MTIKNESVQIRLSPSEALVLFEWLVKLDEMEDDFSTDQAEQQVLWSLEGQLERTLKEVVAVDYQKRVTEAKKIVLGTQV